MSKDGSLVAIDEIIACCPLLRPICQPYSTLVAQRPTNHLLWATPSTSTLAALPYPPLPVTLALIGWGPTWGKYGAVAVLGLEFAAVGESGTDPKAGGPPVRAREKFSCEISSDWCLFDDIRGRLWGCKWVDRDEVCPVDACRMRWLMIGSESRFWWDRKSVV